MDGWMDGWVGGWMGGWMALLSSNLEGALYKSP